MESQVLRSSDADDAIRCELTGEEHAGAQGKERSYWVPQREGRVGPTLDTLYRQYRTSCAVLSQGIIEKVKQERTIEEGRMRCPRQWL